MTSLSGKIAWNTLSQIIGKAASSSLGLVIAAILKRYLGPEDFGLFTFVSVFVLMFGTLADWGLNLISVREASRSTSRAAEIIGNVLVLRLLLSVVAATLAVVAIHLLPYDSQTRLLVSVASPALIVLSLKTSFQIIFQTKLEMHNWALSEITTNLVVVLLLLAVVSLGGSVLAIVLVFLAGHLAAAAVAAVLGYRLLPLKFSLAQPNTRYLLWESLPMGGILVMFTIYNRIDTLIISLYQGQAAVGFYGAAYRIFEVLVLGAAYFANSVLPLISKLAQEDLYSLGMVYRKSFLVLLLLGTTVAIANFIFAPLAIFLLGGEEYSGSVLPLRILSLALIVSYFNHLNGYTLIALGKQWYSLAIALLALLVNVGLNLILIPTYSYPAAALVTFITEALIVVLSLWVVRKTLGPNLNLGGLRSLLWR